MATSKTDAKITGYLGSKHHYNYFEKTKKSVITGTIKTGGEHGHWVQFKAFNKNAERIREAIEKDDVKKLSLTGTYNSETFMSAKDNKQKTVEVLYVNELVKHQVMQIEGSIVKAEQTKSGSGKEITEVLLLNDIITPEKKNEKQFYSVTFWPETLKNLPEGVKLETGKHLAVKGEASILEFQKNGVDQKSYSVNVWNADVSMDKLTEQIKSLEAQKGSPIEMSM